MKLHTVIIIPKGAARAPMILDRTPYNASKFASSAESPRRYDHYWGEQAVDKILAARPLTVPTLASLSHA